MKAETIAEAQRRYRDGVKALQMGELVTGNTTAAAQSRAAWAAIAMGHFQALERLSFWSDTNGVLP